MRRDEPHGQARARDHRGFESPAITIDRSAHRAFLRSRKLAPDGIQSIRAPGLFWVRLLTSRRFRSIRGSAAQHSLHDLEERHGEVARVAEDDVAGLAEDAGEVGGCLAVDRQAEWVD